MAIKGFDSVYFKQSLFDYVIKEFSDWAQGMTADDVVKLVRDSLYPNAESDDAALETLYSDYGNALGLAPNSYFNAAEYRLAWAAKQFQLNVFTSMKNPPLEAYDNEVGINIDPYEHYLKYGAALGVNPSNKFDESKFLQSVIDFCSLVNEDGTPMSVDLLRALAIGAELTALDFFVDSVLPYQELAEKVPAPPVTTDESVNTSQGIFTVTATTDTVTEGENAVFTVSLSHTQYQTTKVKYTLTGTGGAEIGVDTYGSIPSSGILTFGPLSTSKTITVPVQTDSLTESDEGLSLTISKPSEGTKLDALVKTQNVQSCLKSRYEACS